MRKLLLAVIVLSLACYACKKEGAAQKPDSPVNPAEKKYPISFSASEFLSQMEALPGSKKGAPGSGLKDSALAGKVSYLYYLLYDGSSGRFFKSRVQSIYDSTDDFGVYSDSLPIGYYMPTLIASTGPLEILDTALNYYYYLRYRMPEVGVQPDVFFGNNHINVTDSWGGGTVPLYASREVGKIEINIPDAPDSSIRIYTNSAYRTFAHYAMEYSDRYPYPRYLEFQRNSKTNFSTLMLADPSESIYAWIVYPDPFTGQPTTRGIGALPFKKGYKTVVTGKLYTTTPSTDFTAIVDTTWNSFDPVTF